MMDWYTADKVNQFEREQRLRKAEQARATRQARREQQAREHAAAEAGPGAPGLLRRLIFGFGRN